MWDLIVSVPDHCLSFYFAKIFSTPTHVDLILQMQECFCAVAQLASVATVRTCKLFIHVYLGRVMAKPTHSMHFIT